MSANPYRDLPPVDVLADQIGIDLARPLLIEASRRGLEAARLEIAAGQTPDALRLATQIARDMMRGAGVRVINATGVLLHTNLGRAPWSQAAIESASAATSGYGNVEIDIDTGERGNRGGHVTLLLRELTGAEDALVLNNNAAAVLLALAATSTGRAVPVSRGELIEIGGSYRLPAVMEAGGARMVEVGTTNRTRLGDFQTALQLHDCGAVLKVHPSNYRVTGFTEETPVQSLAAVCQEHEIPLIYDIGSGLLDDSVSWLPGWLRDEPAARQSLAAGAALVTFSGDKLLGGPQAGIILGGSDMVTRLRAHPMARALRVDAATYAALAATLTHYLEGEPTRIPFWRYALTNEDGLRRRCESLTQTAPGVIEDSVSTVGAGSAPGMEIPSPVVRFVGGHGLYECLLGADTPILARREAGDLIIDLRAVEPEDDDLIATRLSKCP